jgi:hypothetical protein
MCLREKPGAASAPGRPKNAGFPAFFGLQIAVHNYSEK